jgi:hypothetical protein
MTAKTPNNSSRIEAIKDGQAFIATTHNKLTRITQAFAAGEISRTQFQLLYDRYQRQIMTVAEMIAEADPAAWRQAVHLDGDDSMEALKESLSAQVMGFSIFDREHGLPLESNGALGTESDLIVSMLSTYREAVVELFGDTIQSLTLENGHVFHFVSGKYTTLLLLFSLEPSGRQVRELKKIFQEYEKINQVALKRNDIDLIVTPFSDLLYQPHSNDD